LRRLRQLRFFWSNSDKAWNLQNIGKTRDYYIRHSFLFLTQGCLDEEFTKANR
jgi:hypothetical protein